MKKQQLVRYNFERIFIVAQPGAMYVCGIGIKKFACLGDETKD